MVVESDTGAQVTEPEAAPSRNQPPVASGPKSSRFRKTTEYIHHSNRNTSLAQDLADRRLSTKRGHELATGTVLIRPT